MRWVAAGSSWRVATGGFVRSAMGRGRPPPHPTRRRRRNMESRTTHPSNAPREKIRRSGTPSLRFVHTCLKSAPLLYGKIHPQTLPYGTEFPFFSFFFIFKIPLKQKKVGTAGAVQYPWFCLGGPWTRLLGPFAGDYDFKVSSDASKMT